MNQQNFAQVERAFQAAVQLEPAARGAFLDRELASEPEVRSEVERLLAAAEESTTFLEQDLAASEAAVDRGPDRATARQIGPYRLIRELGRGGMGVVYEAEQAWPRRRVALKIVHGVSVGEAERQFWHEPRVLGRLNHPAVATIYDADQTEDGVPYFVMELIEGERLDKYADDHELSRRDRLRLFCKVCEAIQHAHTKSVIHLDLKPSNILVRPPDDPNASEPQVKVVDFGIAAITGSDTTLPTRLGATGALPGTLAYMSPEQRRGDRDAIDVRSDVYALGVILFKLMTGELPYPVENVNFPEAWRILSQNQPRRPRMLNPGVPLDVETIIRTATADSPQRRYQSVSELVGDVRRYLADLPIAARGPSKFYEWAKFAQRNKGLVAGVAGLVLALSAATVATLTGLQRARAAEAAWRDEAENSEYMLQLLATQYALDGDPISPDLSTPVERRTAFSLKHNAARSKFKLGRVAEAVKDYQRLVDIARRLFPPEAPGGWYLGQLLGEYGECLARMGRYPPAERALLESYEMARDRYGDEHGMTRDAVKRLIVLYQDWRRIHDVEAWAARLAERDVPKSALPAASQEALAGSEPPQPALPDESETGPPQ